MTDKVKRLVAYCQGLFQGENGRELYDRYIEEIKTITPEEVIQVEYEQLQLGMSPKEMLTYVDKLINVFYESLSKHVLQEHSPFIDSMIQENVELEKILESFKDVMKNPTLMNENDLERLLQSIKPYIVHMEKIENIIFPMLEKEAKHFEGLKIMWSLHDDVRQLLKSMTMKLPEFDFKEVGKLFFYLYGLIKKQHLILFPVVEKKLDQSQLEQMYDNSFEIGFSYIEPSRPKKKNHFKQASFDGLIQTGTGDLELETLIQILNVLPVDFTFVNEKDEVAYYNDSEERIFRRAKSVIGRNVRHCHPPESVHIVEEILTSFKMGHKDKAEFWIDIMDKKIYIYYLPIRDHNGRYKGTLEISQDVTYARQLKGERRLLNWMEE